MLERTSDHHPIAERRRSSDLIVPIVFLGIAGMAMIVWIAAIGWAGWWLIGWLFQGWM